MSELSIEEAVRQRDYALRLLCLMAPSGTAPGDAFEQLLKSVTDVTIDPTPALAALWKWLQSAYGDRATLEHPPQLPSPAPQEWMSLAGGLARLHQLRRPV